MKLIGALLRALRADSPRDGFVATRPSAGRGSTQAALPSDATGEGLAPDATAQSAPAAPAGLSRWLFPQVVLLDCDARDKRDVLDLAAATLERFHGVASAPVARALWRREAAIATAIGDGVAVPHARIAGIAEPVTLLIRTLRPIPYGAADRKPVTQLFVIVVPDDGDPQEHLKLLANVAELFSQQAFRERIAAAADTRAALRAFEEYASAIGETAASPAPGDAALSEPARAFGRRSRSPRG